MAVPNELVTCEGLDEITLQGLPDEIPSIENRSKCFIVSLDTIIELRLKYPFPGNKMMSQNNLNAKKNYVWPA